MNSREYIISQVRGLKETLSNNQIQYFHEIHDNNHVLVIESLNNPSETIIQFVNRISEEFESLYPREELVFLDEPLFLDRNDLVDIESKEEVKSLFFSRMIFVNSLSHLGQRFAGTIGDLVITEDPPIAGRATFNKIGFEEYSWSLNPDIISIAEGDKSIMELLTGRKTGFVVDNKDTIWSNLVDPSFTIFELPISVQPNLYVEPFFSSDIKNNKTTKTLN